MLQQDNSKIDNMTLVTEFGPRATFDAHSSSVTPFCLATGAISLCRVNIEDDQGSAIINRTLNEIERDFVCRVIFVVLHLYR